MSKHFTRYTRQDFASFVSTNLFGFFSTTQKALPLLIRSGAGHVVNISTSLTVRPVHDVPSALPILIKGGIEAATRSLAVEYARERARINTVSPGIIDTPMHTPENHEFLRRLSPTPRLGTAREIAEAVLFLDRAEYITGEILRVDGGAHAGGMTLPIEEWVELGMPLLALVLAILLVRRLPFFILARRLVPQLHSTKDALFVGWFGPIGIAAVRMCFASRMGE